jgi:hypothetical protein
MVRKAYHRTIWEKCSRQQFLMIQSWLEYWIKLASGARNILYEEKQQLNDVFLDQDIKTIINLAYNTSAVSAQNWLLHIRDAAFGRSEAAT